MTEERLAELRRFWESTTTYTIGPVKAGEELLAEVDKLRAAIRKHQAEWHDPPESFWMETDPSKLVEFMVKADEQLWKDAGMHPNDH